MSAPRSGSWERIVSLLLAGSVGTINNTSAVAFDRQRHEHLPQTSSERIPCARFLRCFFRANASRGHVRITNREATAIQQRPVGFAVGKISNNGSVLQRPNIADSVSEAVSINIMRNPSFDRRNKADPQAHPLKS